MSARVLLLLPLLVLTACAGQRRPATPMEPGVYAFNGTGYATNQYRHGPERVTVVVMGAVRLLPSGDMVVNGTSGNCRVPASNRPVTRISVDCGGTRLDITPGAGSANVPTTVTIEWRGQCERYQINAAGQSTGTCLEYSWEQRNQQVRINVPLVVSRARDGEE